MSLDVERFFPKELRDVGLFDQVLYAVAEIVRVAEIDLKDSVEKWYDFQVLPEDLLLEIVREFGYEYITDVLDQIQLAAKDKSVAVLVSGDPGLFSLSKSVLTRLGHDRCTVIPAVSSLQVAFAKTGLDWQDAKIISAHHKLPAVKELNFKDYSKIDWRI
ncbi:hypothetical protein LCGC14_3022700, partial [marine sediment metagenome]